jgi:hypothetical protein
VDQHDPQLRHLLVGSGAEHAADPPAVELGDPRRRAGRVGTLGEVRHDPRHECLEGRSPADLGGVQLAVRLDHPAEVARLAEPPDRRRVHGTSSH